MIPVEGATNSQRQGNNQCADEEQGGQCGQKRGGGEGRQGGGREGKKRRRRKRSLQTLPAEDEAEQNLAPSPHITCWHSFSIFN